MKAQADKIVPPEGKREISRREILKSCARLSALPPLVSLASSKVSAMALPIRNPKKLKIAVIGAGAFGGWTALYLLRQGAQVTLFDAWGAGNSRASSGGETRVIRGTYGAEKIYVQMVARAFTLWRENEQRWQKKLYHRTGAFWMFGNDNSFARSSIPLLRDTGFAYEELTVKEARKRYAPVNFDGVQSVLYEKEAGYLLARRACEAVLDSFVKEGGVYRQAAVTPGVVEGGKMLGIRLSDTSVWQGDAYVFACGPWLGKLFADVLGKLIQPTRQEVFFFGTPAGDVRFTEEHLPVWVDYGTRIIYGIPGGERRGFKIADDTHGEPFDPTSGDRIVSTQSIEAMRQFIAFRFPALKDAPLVEARVCQYENTPDGNFIIDRHPGAENVWLIGGGSGHGFKHGPALGEEAAQVVLQKKAANRFFALSRFSK